MVESVCPPQQTLNELALGRLRGGAAAEIRAHTSSCPKCSRLLKGFSDTQSFAEADDGLALGATGAGGTDNDISLGATDAGGADNDISLGATATAPDAERRAETTPASLVRFIAEFRLIRELGQGAMGQVFLAQDTFLDRLVAVKLMTTSESAPGARERFFVEARAIARLHHPNVVTLYRAGEEQGTRYLVSEYVRGQSLEHCAKPMPWQKALELGLGLSRGLAAAHERGVLHRDIKPANTMLTEGGEVKILDFGLAKLMAVKPDAATTDADGAGADTGEAAPVSTLSLTQTGAVMGTPLYMAPEIWRGEPATAQTDVYALGALLYELCTGNPPHLAETSAALKACILDEDATPLALAAPSVNARLAAVIHHCLQRDPQARPTSGEEVRKALERIAARAPSISRRMAAVGLSIVVALFVLLGGVSLARDRQAKRQAALAQRLGQEIKDMEWTLRSARQLPLHDLNREKAIVRKRMTQLEAEMLGYGALGRGLAHYAIGRGHLALHEYPQALTHLEQAMQLGYQGPDAYYALGLVLGLHYQQAKAALRDTGPSSWAKKRLQPLEARYLTPAIAALKRSRQMNREAPQYLEGLIAFYQGDYDAALRHANAAWSDAPWLYEAAILAGDVYVERGEYALNQKAPDQADREFESAVRSYEAAAAIGRSDAEVYENLATAWLPRIRVANGRGRPIGPLYDAVVAASDNSIRAEPATIIGRLKKTQAAQWSMGLLAGERSTAERLKECLSGAEEVLKMQPAHPIAIHFAAFCHAGAAQLAESRGEDALPFVRDAVRLLEPLVSKEPDRFNAANDLSALYAMLTEQLVIHGNPEAKNIGDKGLKVAHETAVLDEESYWPLMWSMDIHYARLLTAASVQEVATLLAQVEADFASVKVHNARDVVARDIYLSAYAVAAYRIYLGGQDPAPQLDRALGSLASLRKDGINMADIERYAILAHYVDAGAKVRARQDPSPAIAELEEDRRRCLALEPKNARCLAFSARAGWLESEWLAQRNQPFLPPLLRALERASAATQSPEKLPDAWQILAETHLRFARSGAQAAEKNRHIAEGLAAVQKGFAINPNYAPGLATQGALLLVRAQEERDPTMRKSLAREAVQAFEQALASDPLLRHQHAPLLEDARALSQQL